ncbi:MAG: MFS transporter [Alphaproteobacteria bacterium]|nr:MFS transporter [Alphaproteobacteria bacterium]
MEAVVERPRHDSWIIGLISTGHFLSHFYYLALPAMFLFLKEEFGVSYAELGLAMTAYSLLGGLVQAPVGFMVDHFGPRRVLLVGLGLNAVAVSLIGFADAYWILLVLAVIAGLGNSVFHPADYSILSGSISEGRLGRAFSIHTFSGFLGGACAPLTMLAIAGFSDWRTAFIATGLVGVAVWAVMLVRSDMFVGESASTKKTAPNGTTDKRGMRLLMTAPVLLFLGFFIFYGMASGGLVAFTASSLINLHGLSVDLANTALTGHLFGVVGGIFFAGLIVDRFNRHGITAAGAMILATAFVLLPLVAGLPHIALIAIMIVVGIGLGLVLPPRDLMVREMTPPGQTGKVFGFVFVGFAVGSGLTPLFFGWLLDAGMPHMVFVIAAAFMAIALCSITAARKLSRRL